MSAEPLPKATIGGKDKIGAPYLTKDFLMKFATSNSVMPSFRYFKTSSKTFSLILCALMIHASSFLLFTARTSWMSFVLFFITYPHPFAPLYNLNYGEGLGRGEFYLLY